MKSLLRPSYEYQFKKLSMSFFFHWKNLLNWGASNFFQRQNPLWLHYRFFIGFSAMKGRHKSWFPSEKKEEENETCHKKIIKLWLFIRHITRRRKFCRALLWKKKYKKNCAIFERKSEICNSINFFLFEKKSRWRAYFCWKVKLRLRADKKRVVGICFDYSLSPHFANPKKHHEIFFIVIDCCFYLTKNK